MPSVPVAGMALILGIDRFMSECRALTNFIGNAVATIVVGEVGGGARHEEAGSPPRMAGDSRLHLAPPGQRAPRAKPCA